MEKKRFYEQPAVVVVGLHVGQSLLAGSSVGGSFNEDPEEVEMS